MGVTPYYCPQIHFLDANGLTDHGIATLPGAVHAGNGVVDYYTTMQGVVGPYLLEVRKPDYIMIGTSLPLGEPVPPTPILDGAYAFHAAIPLPPRAPNTQSFMLLWKRAR
jgi:hypothetical protein